MNLALCSYYKVLPTESRFQNLSLIQKIMLYSEIFKDKKDTIDIIVNTIEALKPWLDKELWSELERVKKETVINSNWGIK